MNAIRKFRLVVRITLAGGYYACPPGQKTRAEWPPSLARFIGMLTDAAMKFARANPEAMTTEEARNIIRWVENQPLPRIYFPAIPAADTVARVASFPPGRDLDEGVLHVKQERVYPVTHPPTPHIYFAFQQCGDPPAGLKAVLNCVDYFGTARSRATACLVDDLPDEAVSLRCLAPAADPDDRRRTMIPAYAPGWFARSEIRHWSGDQPGRPADVPESPPQSACLPPTWVAFVPPDEPAAPPRSLFRKFEIFRLLAKGSGSLPFGRNAGAVADSVRGALLELSDRLLGPGKAPVALVADTLDNHVACLPLPNVFGPHPNNRIAAVGLGLPSWVRDPEEEAKMDRLVANLTATKAGQYTMNHSWALERVIAPPTSHILRRSTWCRAATEWYSATPLELDRHLFARGDYRREVANWLQTHAVKHLQLPEIVEIDVDYSPRGPGPDPANFYASRNMLKNHPNPGITCHVWVRFKTPVRGPLCLGRGRFFGLGLMVPIYAKPPAKNGSPAAVAAV